MRIVKSAFLLSAILTLFSCDSNRLTQFASFAAAGSQYVQYFHQLTAQAASAMIASDSSVLIIARSQIGNAIAEHVPEYTANVQKEDKQLEEYLANLQKLDAHATLIGTYFAAVTALTNGKANSQAASAADAFLDSINTLNPQIEKATVAGQPIKNFVQPLTSLVVDHFEGAALEANLKKAAPVLDQALTLQEAAVSALSAQIKASQGASLEIRETTDVIGPYLKPGLLSANWPANREAFLRDEVTLAGLSSAQSAISQLHIAFRQLVQDKNASPDFAALFSEIGKMAGYAAAVKSTATVKTTGTN
jgi:hypothetical protein